VIILDNVRIHILSNFKEKRGFNVGYSPDTRYLTTLCITVCYAKWYSKEPWKSPLRELPTSEFSAKNVHGSSRDR